jgi:hypothetical protein
MTALLGVRSRTAHSRASSMEQSKPWKNVERALPAKGGADQ